MRSLPLFLAIILLSCFISSCHSDNTKLDTTAAEPVSENTVPAAAATAASLPAPLSPSAFDLRVGVEQQTPKQGYLQVVAAKAFKVEPMHVTLPWMWGSDPDRPGGRTVGTAPGYRISYEAVIRWKPTGYGPQEKVPTSLPLYSPNGTDSLAGFQVGAEGLTKPERFKVSQIQPGTPVTVRGTLYAYMGQNDQKQSALVVYPYRDPLGLPEPNRMTFLPIKSTGL
jgi:hypothetical protein